MAERPTVALLALTLVLSSSGVAFADPPDPTAELNEERDLLIDKITHGVELTASVQRFSALVKQRDAVIATSFAAKEKVRLEQEKARAELDLRRKWVDEYHKTNDYEVSWRCTLSPDPAHPIASREGRFRPDWGKVTRKESTRLQPKNELDEGEPITLYEVAGVAGTYQFRGERFDAARKPFSANVGDLVLICNGGESSESRLPAGWGPRLVHSGFAVRLAKPPLIVQKAKWNPIHVTGMVFYWAIHDVKWKFPLDSFVLANVSVGKDLGGGRWDMPSDQHSGESWVLEVPPRVKNQQLLVPGHEIWMILGNPRFDKGLKKLVLVAEDLEARYLTER
jgi:hypothetical protein